MPVSDVKDTVVQETARLCPGGTHFLEEFKVQALASPLNTNNFLFYLWGKGPRQQPGWGEIKIYASHTTRILIIIMIFFFFKE